LKEAGEEGSLPKILICGVGNRLKRDDGTGPHVVDQLQDQELPANVTLLDFGISAFKTALHIGEYDKVIFVDAIQSGNEPGHVYKNTICRDDLSESPSLGAFGLSLHESDLEQILATASMLDSYPKEVVLVGCEPDDLELGLGLSESVEKAVGEIIKLLLSDIT